MAIFKIRKSKASKQLVKYAKSSDHQKLLRLTKIVRAQRPELKFFDSYLSPTSISTSGGVYPLFNDPSVLGGLLYLQQGNSAQTRIGNKIKLKSFLFRYNVLCGDYYNQLRIMLFYDKECSGAIPNVTDVLQANASGNVACISPVRKTNITRYQILYDKVHSLVDNIGGTSLTSTSQINRKYYKRMSLPVEFQNSNNDSSCLGKNQIFMLVISDSVALPHPSIEYWSRTRFTDN